MSKNIKGAIPKWRFLEFKGNGDWERKKLGEMAFIVNDKIAIEKLNAETYISTENMLPNFVGVSTASQLPQTGNFTKFKVGDILVSNIRPYLKKVWKSNKTGGASNDVIVFRSNSDIDSNFLEFILKNELFINYVMKNAKGLKMPRGDKESMLIYPVYIPPYPTFSEQQKIADCLSSIDDLISAEEKKLSLLNDYKKGWMQKLFPTEGKTVPEWRFPEFRDSGEWENTTIGKIADYENGKAHENNIIDNGKYIVVNSKFISTEGEIIKYTNEANLLAYKGDILMVLSDVPNGRALSKCYLVDKDNLYTVNQRVCRITPKKINSILLFYTINRNKYFLAFDDGVKQTNLRKKEVLHCSVVIPKDSNEQKKIADFLSGIDELLCRQIDKIETLKQHKKALMQGLFPSIEEVCR